MHLFLIRHPQPALDSSVCYGQTDITLHADTLLNLPSLTNYLLEQLPDNTLVFSSPLLRCRLLAEALHAQPVYDDRLKEMHFGEWETRPWSDIPRQQLDQWAADPLHYQIPGGESVAHMQKRVLDFMREQQVKGVQHLALVTHAGVMKIIFAHIHSLSPSQWMNMHFDYGSLHQINWKKYE